MEWAGSDGGDVGKGRGGVWRFNGKENACERDDGKRWRMVLKGKGSRSKRKGRDGKEKEEEKTEVKKMVMEGNE